MSVTLSIKNVPAALAERLKARAARNHRSLQGELMAIIEQASYDRPATLAELGDLAKRLGIRSEAGEAARMVREDRDDPCR